VRELVDPGQQVASGVLGPIGFDSGDPAGFVERAVPETMRPHGYAFP
jgi:hypothetical protein